MPRPGPRPYVCEKRAWHSDRHKPMRGSLIKEIFRVASEIHSPATRKNKEWQEKLPVVVLKAEEIMYSKANSEAEYLDLRTLKDRANDAINTIIKRDENAETGHFLQPCIEAALNLGCTPRRTLRSQRYNNPRCYLNIGTEEEGSPAGRHQTISPTCFGYYADLLKSKGQNAMMHSGSQLLNPITENGNKLPLVSENQSLHMNECPGSDSYSVYPLYYVDQHRSQGPKQGFPATPSSCPPHMLDPPKKQCGVLCDLSLRLGVHFPSVVDRYNQELDSGVGYTSHEGHKSNDPHAPQTNGVDTLKRNLQAEGTLLDTTLKKQKAGLGPSGDQLFRWQPKTVRSYLSGRMKSSGLLG